MIFIAWLVYTINMYSNPVLLYKGGIRLSLNNTAMLARLSKLFFYVCLRALLFRFSEYTQIWTKLTSKNTQYEKL